MKRMTGAAIALTLLGSTAAFAQNGQYGSEQRQVQPQNRIIGESQSDNGYARDQGQNDRETRSNEVRDNPHWSRGDRLPPEYGSRQYVVSNWKASHLRQPPRGYHWVRVNNQYVLAAVAGGVIADIIMNAERGR